MKITSMPVLQLGITKKFLTIHYQYKLHAKYLFTCCTQFSTYILTSKYCYNCKWGIYCGQGRNVLLISTVSKYLHMPSKI
jgi:hypothetical protein